MKLQPVWFVIPVAFALHAGVAAQSLADVAKAEEARRRAAGTRGVKVYTNDDLGGASATGAAPAAPATASGAASKIGDPAAKSGEQKAVDPTKTQAYWKDRATAIQQSIARYKLLLEALQVQINGMNAEFLTMDDPGHRGLLEARLQRATGEMQRVQQDIEKQTKAAAGLEEEARKAGVPSGWIR